MKRPPLPGVKALGPFWIEWGRRDMWEVGVGKLSFGYKGKPTQTGYARTISLWRRLHWEISVEFWRSR